MLDAVVRRLRLPGDSRKSPSCTTDGVLAEICHKEIGDSGLAYFLAPPRYDRMLRRVEPSAYLAALHDLATDLLMGTARPVSIASRGSSVAAYRRRHTMPLDARAIAGLCLRYHAMLDAAHCCAGILLRARH